MTMDKAFTADPAEKKIYNMWESAGCFKAGANSKPDAPSFSIVLPPPNVTGSLHIGHALNHTLQDILVRWHRMRGFDTLWQPGQDHAGIATQMVVERKLAENNEPDRRTMGREAFLERAWEQKNQSSQTIIDQDKRLGVSLDWSRNKFTLGRTDKEQMSRAVSQVFVKLYNQGLVYKDKRLVNWDPHFETAISDLEVEQKEIQGHLWHFRYPLANKVTYEHPVTFDENGKAVSFETRNYVVVATTRPETMLGDTGVAVHPDDERYQDLIGKFINLPLVNRRIPIVADTYADPSTGTGAVKITPAHDFNDFEVGKRCKLQIINILSSKAEIKILNNQAFLQDTQPEKFLLELHGADRFTARQKIVEAFSELHLLDHTEDHSHTVPHGDRSKVVVEPYLTDQWFVDAKTLAQPALEAVKKGHTKFVPQNWDKTYFQWLENIEPWCISRQLWWGHQIPVWYDDKGKAYCAMSEEEAFEQAGHTSLVRDNDVLDTWFSSALWPFSTLGWPEETPELARYYKTDVLITGFDIIFFWVARMMMMGLHFTDDVPFHTVYVHALVRDEQGKKMSKSLGNVIDPLDLADKYGADAVRFTLSAMAAMGRDIRLSLPRVEGYRNFGTKLWNAARFCEMNECSVPKDFDPSILKSPVNQWIVMEVAHLRVSLDKALEQYRFDDASNILYSFIWKTFCDWYLELAKPVIQDIAEQDETRYTAGWVLDQVLIMLHPFMPFITEEIWQSRHSSLLSTNILMLTDWPAYTSETFGYNDAKQEIPWIITMIENIRSVRAEINVPAGAKVEIVVSDLDEEVKHRLYAYTALLSRLARVKNITYVDTPPEKGATIPLEGATLTMLLEGIIDFKSEHDRLQKAYDKLIKEEQMLSGKLSNEKFLAKAPENIITQQRERLDTIREEKSKIDKAIQRFKSFSS